MSRFKNLVGEKFNKLKVISFVDIKNKNSRWLCKCECGNKTIAFAQDLKTGHTKSCGCLFLKKITKHGMHKTKFYGVWEGMKTRCLYKKHKHYNNYGGRGITICNQWLKFLNFRDDMYESYKEHKLNNNYTSIDRINNNGNYELSNCRWATKKEQCNNRRLPKKLCV